ncbi:MAG: SEC-C metal-binding domain-containing protein [Pirellulales bacterium]
MLGNWEVVRQMLGVEGLGLEMPKDQPHSMEYLRMQNGVGVFSPQAIFRDGELVDEAVEDYRRRASEAFSESSEGRLVVERFGSVGWFDTLLEFGLQYRAEIVDGMTLESVQEFVHDFVPRKVSAAPDEAASILYELTLFWEFLDRAHQLPQAKAIADWLKADSLLADLEEAMSDPENFDMAKSLVMMGKRSGFDMTSEAGISGFMTAFNLSRGFSQPSHDASPLSEFGLMAAQERVGRNDPCPCGSGKKFKKCCLRVE